MASLLEQSGLHDIEVAEVTGEVRFESAEAYWEFITDVIAPIATALKSIDAGQREAVKRAVIEAAAKSARGADIPFAWSALIASGTK